MERNGMERDIWEERRDIWEEEREGKYMELGRKRYPKRYFPSYRQ